MVQRWYTSINQLSGRSKQCTNFWAHDVTGPQVMIPREIFQKYPKTRFSLMIPMTYRPFCSFMLLYHCIWRHFGPSKLNAGCARILKDQILAWVGSTCCVNYVIMFRRQIMEAWGFKSSELTSSSYVLRGSRLNSSWPIYHNRPYWKLTWILPGTYHQRSATCDSLNILIHDDSICHGHCLRPEHATNHHKQ